ncbi:MAG: hypothetical protein ACREGD_05215 [Candidatus Saccharimonadales bacterium]
MSDLKSDYREIEERLDWPEQPNGIGKGNQFYRLITDLKVKVQERSLSEKLDPSVYEDRLYKLLDFVSDLRSALNHYSVHVPDEKKNEQRVWYHRADHQITGLGKKDDQPEIYRESLLEAAATYLANPWLQHDQIDWIFVDSLIVAEISAYRESILTGQAVGKTNWAYIFTGGDIEKIYWFQVKKALGFFALRYIAPPAIVFALYYFKYETASLIAGAVYAVYLLLHAVLWPLRYRKRKLEQKTLQEHTDRLQSMINAYYYCKPPIVSLATLRTYLNKAIEAGAIFDGALFSVLNRIEATRGEAFMPFTESA